MVLENLCPNIFKEPPLEWMRMCLWIHMKNQIYECLIETTMDLIARFAVVASDIQEIPSVFSNVRLFQLWRCKAYITVGVHFSEEFLREHALIKFLLIKYFLKYRLSFLGYFFKRDSGKYLLTSYNLRSDHTFYGEYCS